MNKLLSYTAEYLDKMETLLSDTDREKIDNDIKHYVETERATRVKLLRVPLVLFPKEDFLILQNIINKIFSAKIKILKYLKSIHSDTEIFTLLAVSKKIHRFIDWRCLEKTIPLIGRADILVSTDGNYFICEFNIGTSISGMHGFELSKKFLAPLHLHVKENTFYKSPYHDIAELLHRICLKKSLSRVVILDWSTYDSAGRFKYHNLKEYVANACKNSEVYLINELEYPEAWFDAAEAKNTLVYRLFLDDEMEDNNYFFNKLYDSGATIINTFETCLLGSKHWLALLHDKQFSHLLDDSEKQAIEKYIPYTTLITENNFSSLLANKSDYVFKRADSYEGRGVLMGHEKTAQEIIETINGDYKNWSAQTYIASVKLNFPHERWDDYIDQNVVLGIYHINDKFSGVHLRLNPKSTVVNVYSGARTTWGIPVSLAEKNDFFGKLEQRSKNKECNHG